ncbi:putative bifunctional P-450/NADPH-P450 reductase 2 [Pseudoruegeria aquimaris]|uniref:Putative bifunctional P-450/NADPH-P450 reductase 2 n=2 Tax=Pseudoruegeria aquimaris TaxID=393663 RepID=A0A1Y5TBT2_9RHOB|nr:putative bifunctional P-450/NADPH-P450 reductase 2 [Pseudoruegeria aquimaris]
MKREPIKVPLRTKPWGVTGVIRFLRTARRNLVEMIPETATIHPMLSSETMRRWHMVMDPQALKRILKDNVENYPKAEVAVNIMRTAIGESIFVAHGQYWLWQRRTAAPIFSYRNVANLAPIMTEATARTVEKIARIPDDEPFNILDPMIEVTFEIISDVTLSNDDSLSREQMHRALDSFIKRTGRVSLLDALGAPFWIPRPSRLFSARDLTNVQKIVDRAIEKRRAIGPNPNPDLTDLFLAGEDPVTKRRMTTEELRNNLLTFVVAGHETSALTLAWAIYLCSIDPEVQEKAAEEARAVLNGRTAVVDDVAKMPYVRCIIEETLRLYPPFALLIRSAKEDDTLIGREVRKGDPLILPIYALHRNRLLWEDPDSFKPERFQDRKSIARFSYLPFGDGPRICIGAEFALQEMVIVLGTLLSRFRFDPVEGKEPKPVMLLTLRPQGGVWVRARKR